MESTNRFHATKEQQFLVEIIQNINNEHYTVCSEPLKRDLDWESLMKEAKNQKVFPIVYNILRTVVPNEWHNEYMKHQEIVNIYLQELFKIVQSAEVNNIKLVLHKGFAIAKLVYNDLYMRQIGDIDLLINEADVDRADKLLRELDYQPVCGLQHYWNIIDENDYRFLPFPILKDDTHHEFYGYIKKINSLNYSEIYEVELGRHLHNTVRTPQIYEFINNSVNIRIHHFECRTFDLPHTFLSICENLYEDAEEWYSEKPSLKNCCDLYLFIESYPEMDWYYIKELSLKYELCMEIETVMGYLAAIFPSERILQISGIFTNISASSPRYRFDWVSNFEKRLFLDHEARLKEIVTITKQHCFSNTNRNFVKPYQVSKEEFGQEIDVLNSVDLDITYSMMHLSENIYIRIVVNPNIMSTLNTYEIVLFLINNNPNYQEGYSLIKSSFSLKTASNEWTIQSDSELSYKIIFNGNKVIISIPFSQLPFETNNNGTCKVGYGIAIRKEIIDSLFHWVTLSPYQKEFWNHPPILEVI